MRTISVYRYALAGEKYGIVSWSLFGTPQGTPAGVLVDGEPSYFDPIQKPNGYSAEQAWPDKEGKVVKVDGNMAK